MKASIMIALLACITSIPLSAGEGLKLELIGPDKSAVIPQEQLNEAATCVDASAALNAERRENKLSREDLRRLETIAMKGQSIEQGIVLTYRISNTSDEVITFRYGGDATGNRLALSGPGAVNLPYQGMMTMEFRMGREITLEAGASKEFTIKNLKHGKRDMDRWLITKAGEYEVQLTVNVKMRNERVELQAEPVKLKVVTE